MVRSKKKGFTLVELLVVIAILAILATVSVVGYTAFTKKAKESNALTEMTQARDLIKAELMDGEVYEVVAATGTGDTATDAVTLQLTSTTTENGTTWVLKVTGEWKDDYFVTAFSDLAALNGAFTAETDTINTGTENEETVITEITYTTDSATATWTIATDTIETGAAVSD